MVWPSEVVTGSTGGHYCFLWRAREAWDEERWKVFGKFVPPVVSVGSWCALGFSASFRASLVSAAGGWGTAFRCPGPDLFPDALPSVLGLSPSPPPSENFCQAGLMENLAFTGGVLRRFPRESHRPWACAHPQPETALSHHAGHSPSSSGFGIEWKPIQRARCAAWRLWWGPGLCTACPGSPGLGGFSRLGHPPASFF